MTHYQYYTMNACHTNFARIDAPMSAWLWTVSNVMLFSCIIAWFWVFSVCPLFPLVVRNNSHLLVDGIRPGVGGEGTLQLLR